MRNDAAHKTPDNNEVPETPAAEAGVPENGLTTLIGELSEQARMALGTIQRQQGEIQNQIGSLELHKSQLIGNHNGLQVQAKNILDSEAVRMGIPKGKPWQVTPDGKAHLVG